MVANIFVELPVEVTQQVIIACDPNDVSALARSCHHFQKIIYTHSEIFIWRSLFLERFDDPRLLTACYLLGYSADREKIYEAARSVKYDWSVQLKRRVAAMNLVQNKERAESATCAQRKAAIEAIISVVETSTPQFLSSSPQHESRNLAWLSSILGNANASTLTLWPSLAHPLLQPQRIDLSELDARSKLHAYFDFTYPNVQSGPTGAISSPSILEDHEDPISSTLVADHSSFVAHAPDRPQNLRRVAQAIVYEGRSYSKANFHGPFYETSSLDQSGWDVNWRQVAALKIVVAFDLEQAANHQSIRVYGNPAALPPTGIDAACPLRAIAPLTHNNNSGLDREAVDPSDWAGVGGRWTRAVCFLEYAMYFQSSEYFGNIQNPLPFRESIRMDSMELHVTHTDPCPTKLESEYGHRPRLHFEGVSNAGAPDESNIRGFVESHPLNGAVRWKMTRRTGRTSWEISGVQLGSAGSRLGVVGSWTTIHHTDGDPVGPFWMWRLFE